MSNFLLWFTCSCLTSNVWFYCSVRQNKTMKSCSGKTIKHLFSVNISASFQSMTCSLLLTHHVEIIKRRGALLKHSCFHQQLDLIYPFFWSGFALPVSSAGSSVDFSTVIHQSCFCGTCRPDLGPRWITATVCWDAVQLPQTPGLGVIMYLCPGSLILTPILPIPAPQLRWLKTFYILILEVCVSRLPGVFQFTCGATLGVSSTKQEATAATSVHQNAAASAPLKPFLFLFWTLMERENDAITFGGNKVPRTDPELSGIPHGNFSQKLQRLWKKA